MTAPESQPWYRQFWPWFLIVLPATVVIAGIATVVIAVRSGDSLVSDNYYREGLAINRMMAQERRAEELQLRAELVVDQQQLRLQLQGNLQSFPPTVLARFQHPLQAEKDFTVPLSQIGQHDYSGELSGLIDGRWYLKITDLNDEWQLHSEVWLVERQPIRLQAGEVDG